MKKVTRREILGSLAFASTGSLIRSSGAHSLFHKRSPSLQSTEDSSVAMCDSTMRRIPDSRDLGGWGYAISLYLYGQYLVYLRTGDKKYLEYIRGWIDKHVNEDGVIDRQISALDYMLPGNLLLVLFKETKNERYRKAAEAIRHRFRYLSSY